MVVAARGPDAPGFGGFFPPTLRIHLVLSLGLNNSSQSQREAEISAASRRTWGPEGEKPNKLFFPPLPSLFLASLLGRHGIKSDSVSIIIKM